MELGLTLKQTQTLSPQMVQAMEILQMGSQELLGYIEQTIQENPVLEREERPGREEDKTALLRRKLEWLESTDIQNCWYHQQDAEDAHDPLDSQSSDPLEESLYYYLRSQVRFEHLPSRVAQTADHLMQCLDSNGWLDEAPADLALRLGVDREIVDRALQVVQGLEPAGVGARDLSECLCLQLERRGERGLALTIASSYLEAMSRDRYHLIAKQTGASRAEVNAACALIRSLDPRPGMGFSARENLRYIDPDLIVVKFADHFELLTNDSYLPSLRLSGYYSKLYHETGDDEVKGYLNDKLRQAKWVIQSVEQRRSTLMDCARCLVERQERFFRHGPGNLRPLGLADVAAQLGVHESTVSRAVRDKYLQCTYGVYPLGYFFTRGLSGGSGGDATPDQAKERLRALIQGEDKRRPFSDQKLAQLLAGQGIALSRRTVAKYRDELGIPSTTARKEF